MAYVVQSVAKTTTGSTTLAITTGAKPQAGNLLLAFVTCFQGFSSINSKWVDSGITVTDANSGVTKVLYRYCDGSDTTALTLGVANNGTFWVACLYEVAGVSGVFGSDKEQSVANQTPAGAGPIQSTLLTSTNDFDLALAYSEEPQGVSPSGYGAGWTKDQGASGGGYGYGCAQQAFPTKAASVQIQVPGALSFVAASVVVLLTRTESAVGQSKAIGPTGLLGTPPRKFRESNDFAPTGLASNERATQAGLEAWLNADPAMQSTQVGLEVWTATTRAIEGILPRAKLGPVGFLGIPPRKFREAKLDSLYSVDVPVAVLATQAGLEVWCTADPKDLSTQAGLEVWCKIATTGFTPPPFLWVVT